MRFIRILSTLFALGAGYCADVAPLHAQSVKQVTVTCAATQLALGSRTTCTARARLANGTFTSNKPVVWSSSRPDVALVASTTGRVSTLAAGSATIVATIGAGNGSAVITVTGGTPPPPPTVASVTLLLGAPSLAVGQSAQATATAKDSAGDVIAGQPIGYTSLSPSIASVSTGGVVSGSTTGTATIRATAGTQHADATMTVTSPVVVPPDTTSNVTLPHLLTTSVASTVVSRTYAVSSGANLQTVFDTAKAGDQINLPCNITYSGNFTLALKSNYVTVASLCTKPAEGTRTDTLHQFTRISSPNNLPAIASAAGGGHWRFIGIEFTTDPSVPTSNDIVELGYGTATTQSQIPKGFIFDRSYIHGWPNQWVHRCVTLNSDSTAFVENYISECHADIDAQAIWGWAGNGPYKITNNYLEASTEIVGFGGADPLIPGLVPSDIEIRGNLITRQMAWKTTPSRWVIKNLIELKEGKRVLIDGNVLANSWVNGQLGWGIVIWTVNQQGTCTWCETSNLTIRNNVLTNVASGFQLSRGGNFGGDPLGSGLPTGFVPMHHVSITNNVVIGLDNPAVQGGGTTFQIADVDHLWVEHNTAFNPTATSPSETFFLFPGTAPAAHMIIRNNLLGGGTYTMFFGNGGSYATMFDALTTVFTANVVVGGSSFSSGFPSGNFYPAAFSSLGLVGGATCATSVTAPIDSLALTGGSTYHHAATDGTDIGANIATVKSAVLNVGGLSFAGSC